MILSIPFVDLDRYIELVKVWSHSSGSSIFLYMQWNYRDTFHSNMFHNKTNCIFLFTFSSTLCTYYLSAERQTRSITSCCANVSLITKHLHHLSSEAQYHCAWLSMNEYSPPPGNVRRCNVSVVTFLCQLIHCYTA